MTRRLVLCGFVFAAGLALGPVFLSPRPAPAIDWSGEASVLRVNTTGDKALIESPALVPTRAEVDGRMHFYTVDRSGGQSEAIWHLTLAGGKVHVWATEKQAEGK